MRKVVSFVGGADLHHLGDDAAFCVSASGLLGGGLVRSSLCRRCLGRHPVVVVLEVSVVGDPDGVLYCGKLVAVMLLLVGEWDAPLVCRLSCLGRSDLRIALSNSL